MIGRPKLAADADRRICPLAVTADHAAFVTPDPAFFAENWDSSLPEGDKVEEVEEPPISPGQGGVTFVLEPAAAAELRTRAVQLQRPRLPREPARLREQSAPEEDHPRARRYTRHRVVPRRAGQRPAAERNPAAHAGCAAGVVGRILIVIFDP